MNLIEQKAFLEKILPQGKEFVIAAKLHFCFKCKAKSGTCIFSDIRFPQGYRNVIRDGELIFNKSKHLTNGIYSNGLGWMIPWRDIAAPSLQETGIILAEFAYIKL